MPSWAEINVTKSSWTEIKATSQVGLIKGNVL
jgi:hypothetical protein